MGGPLFGRMEAETNPGCAILEVPFKAPGASFGEASGLQRRMSRCKTGRGQPCVHSSLPPAPSVIALRGVHKPILQISDDGAHSVFARLLPTGGRSPEDQLEERAHDRGEFAITPIYICDRVSLS